MNKNKILEILNLSPETERAEICNNAYSGEAPDYPILSQKPLTRLSAVVGLLCGKYEDYKSLGVPEKVIEETFRDVSLRARIYEKKTGKPGISKEDALWFRHIINC